MTADESKEDITSGHHQNNNLEVVACELSEKRIFYGIK